MKRSIVALFIGLLGMSSAAYADEAIVQARNYSGRPITFLLRYVQEGKPRQKTLPLDPGGSTLTPVHVPAALTDIMVQDGDKTHQLSSEDKLNLKFCVQHLASDRNAVRIGYPVRDEIKYECVQLFE